ncbi:MAG: AAA family ATPase [Fluviicola sp.]
MKSILRVENFGPIKDAILDLRNVNVLIGPQASGKSTLAKLYTICKSPSFYHENKEVSLKLFFEKLEYFSISSFIRKDTVIEYNSSTHNFKFEKNKIFFKNELDKYFLNFEDDDNDFIQNL